MYEYKIRNETGGDLTVYNVQFYGKLFEVLGGVLFGLLIVLIGLRLIYRARQRRKVNDLPPSYEDLKLAEGFPYRLHYLPAYNEI